MAVRARSRDILASTTIWLGLFVGINVVAISNCLIWMARFFIPIPRVMAPEYILILLVTSVIISTSMIYKCMYFIKKTENEISHDEGAKAGRVTRLYVVISLILMFATAVL